MPFVGRLICVEKFDPCMSCCPLNGGCPLFRLSTNGGFTVTTHLQISEHVRVLVDTVDKVNAVPFILWLPE